MLATIILLAALAVWIVFAHILHDKPYRGARLALFPALGVVYSILFWLGGVFELDSLTFGKSLGNVLEIPLVFFFSGFALKYFDRYSAMPYVTLAGRRRFVGRCYAVAAVFYFAAPMIPE